MSAATSVSRSNHVPAAPEPAFLPLKSLVESVRNPRRTKPDQEAHRKLVANIKSIGLIHPLVVRPLGGKKYGVIAGNRRLLALREIHGKANPFIPCMVHNVDESAAGTLSLGENFAREAMHPLDEAAAFSALASAEGVDALGVAHDFGVSERYVKQRMKLADLAKPIAAAYRAGTIDTRCAEAFSAVPQAQQLALWKELDGNHIDADVVRGRIDTAWIPASRAIFKVDSLPEFKVSADLFGNEVLIERAAFMAAQKDAAEARKAELRHEGWSAVEVCDRESVRDRLWSMDKPSATITAAVRRKLEKIDSKRKALVKQSDRLAEDDPKQEALNEQYEKLEAQAHSILAAQPPTFSESTLAKGTVFLILDSDGSLHVEPRVPKPGRGAESGNGHAGENGKEAESLTPDDLTDPQTAMALAHHAYAVREALLGNEHLRLVVLAMMLHDKVRREGIALRHDTNSSTLFADMEEAFVSPVKERLVEARKALDPLTESTYFDEKDVFERLSKLQVDPLCKLIDLLVVALLTHRPTKPTPLLCRLARELKVDLRAVWTPDAQWFKRFRKTQLIGLLTRFNGKLATPTPDTKHGDLVKRLADLFASADAGRLDAKLTKQVKAWCPAPLRDGIEGTRQQAR